MMRRLPTAITPGAALILTATLALPGVSQGATSGCPTPPAMAPTKTAIPPQLQLLTQKLKHAPLRSIRISFHTELETDTGD